MGGFLDRDGTINEERHLVHKSKDFILLPKSAEAIRLLNKNKVPVIVVHNAATVSRGLCSEKDMMVLHQKMKLDLKRQGAQIDIILFCPHRPDALNKVYAHKCKWQKPNTGMLTFVSKKYNIDPSRSFVVGDTTRDVFMAHRSNAVSILVKTGHAGKDRFCEVGADYTVGDLLAAARLILNKK